MGAKPLLITQKQVAACLKGAAVDGVFYRIEFENSVVRFIPCADPQKVEPAEEPRTWHL